MDGCRTRALRAAEATGDAMVVSQCLSFCLAVCLYAGLSARLFDSSSKYPITACEKTVKGRRGYIRARTRHATQKERRGVGRARKK